jgi:hypothetical protein
MPSQYQKPHGRQVDNPENLSGMFTIPSLISQCKRLEGISAKGIGTYNRVDIYALPIIRPELDDKPTRPAFVRATWHKTFRVFWRDSGNRKQGRKVWSFELSVALKKVVVMWANITANQKPREHHQQDARIQPDVRKITEITHFSACKCNQSFSDGSVMSPSAILSVVNSVFRAKVVS